MGNRHMEKQAPVILLNGSLADSVLRFRGPLISDLISRGYSVHVSAPGLEGAVAADVAALGAMPHNVTLARAGSGLIGDSLYALSLYRLIKAHGVDIVIGYTIKPNIWGSLAARAAGVRSVSMVTGLGFAFIPGPGWKRRLTQWIAHRLYRLATTANSHIVFQNRDDHRDFAAAGCLSPSAAVVIVDGSGVDTQHFAVAALPAEPVFLVIARLLWTKGIREYVEAARIVRARLPDARFLLAGYLDDGPDGASQADLDSWIGEGIEFLGQLADIRPAMATASAYVLPSYREGTPRTVLEAMAMGRPVITTDAPGCRETVRDGVNGFLVPIQSVSDLAEAMIALGSDADLRQQFGAASRQMVEARYAVERVNRQLIDGLAL